MRKTAMWGVMGVVSVLAVSVLMAAGPGPAGAKWEYVQSFRLGQSQAGEDLGAAGWELVAVSSNEKGAATFYYKRPR